MAFTRKHLGDGQVASASVETTIYQPASSAIKGVIASAVFFNANSTQQITVTIYGPHSGAATTEDIIQKFILQPEQYYVCPTLVNKVAEGAESHLFSVLCDTATALNFCIDGGEEEG